MEDFVNNTGSNIYNQPLVDFLTNNQITELSTTLEQLANFVNTHVKRVPIFNGPKSSSSFISELQEISNNGRIRHLEDAIEFTKDYVEGVESVSLYKSITPSDFTTEMNWFAKRLQVTLDQAKDSGLYSSLSNEQTNRRK